MSSIHSTISAANCTASTWIANTARSVGSALVGGATKVANLVSTTFQALAQYASAAFSHAQNAAVLGFNAVKANPQVASGTLAVVLLATAAYAYKNRAATV